MSTDTSTDPLHDFSPSDIVVSPGEQTLADAAAERTQTITIPTTVDGRSAHASVTAMLDAIAAAATQIIGPFVVQLDDGEFIVAVTDDEDPDACVAADVQSRRDRAIIEAVALLPTWARSSQHEAQQRAVSDLVYAQQYSSIGAAASIAYRTYSWRVTLDAQNDAATWTRPWQSTRADLSAPNADEAAQLLWQHIGCPRSVGLLIVPSSGESIWYDVEDWAISPGTPYYAPVHAFSPLRRADSDAELPDGIDEVVREIHRARTTGARHASRIRSAQCSIVQYVLDECWSVRPSGGSGGEHDTTDEISTWVVRGSADGCAIASIEHWHVWIPRELGRQPYTEEESARIVAAIAVIDLHGVGGPGGIDGGATATMSWRSGLGKGRRQASDGQAWDAAIQSLVGSDPNVEPADVMLALPFVRPHDLEWPMVYALDRAYHHRDDAETSRVWCGVARAVMARAQEPGAPLDGPAVRLGRRYGVA